MKKVIALIIVLLGCMGIILLLRPSITYVATKGYMIPDTYHVSSSVAQGQGDTVYLHQLEADTMIYSSLLKDYDYENKTAVDTTYPMYTNNGASLYFLFHELWLISDEFQFLESYDGLYLTDGHTYNADLSQADGEEFLLVALDNGLFMNAQHVVFQGIQGETDIAANSILQFSNDDIRYYEYDTAELGYGIISEVDHGTITIGEHTYDYEDFLKALGLFEEAIKTLEKGDDIYDIQQEIKDLLEEDDDNPSGSQDATHVNHGDGQSDTGNGQHTPGSESNTGQGSASLGGLGVMGNAGGGSSAGGAGSVPGSAIGAASGAVSGALGGAAGGAAGSEGAGGSGSGELGSGSGPASPAAPAAPEAPANPDGVIGDNNNSTVGDGSGISPELPYQEPVVSLHDMDSWAYAINGHLSVDDPSGVIRKGISVAVYGKITGTEKVIDTVDGMNVYSGTDNTGGSAKLRKTFYSDQEFTLDGIEPGQNFYIQYTYSYYIEKLDDNGEKIYTIAYAVSDFYEISTKTIAESHLPTILLTYDTTFAPYSDRFELQNVLVENDSAYDAEDTSFENFKLNVLPYISKLTFDFKDDNTKDVTISSSTIRSAAIEEILYTSSTNSLSSNKKHEYTLVATDKYGNELPLKINGSSYNAYTGVVYTAKKQPTVTIEEVENITDSLTVKVTVSDEDGALDPDVPLSLIALDTSGNTTMLTGVWDNKDSLASVNNIVSLEAPEDNKEYVFTLDSLAFARTYTFRVTGDYNPQPDAASSPVLGIKEDILFGSQKIYTASLTTGKVDVSVTLTNALILDTGAEIGLKITNNSTVEILPLIDELRIAVNDVDNQKEKISLVLKESELSSRTIEYYLAENSDAYNEEFSRLTIYDEKGVKIELTGSREVFTGKTIWELLLLSQETDLDTGVTTVSNGIDMSIVIDQGILETSTVHEITYDAIVIKSGVEYEIPVTLSSSKFQTKKLQPIVSMDSAFIANDFVEYFDFNITDPDDAVVGTNAVELQLYVMGENGNTQLQKLTISADDDPQSVRFEGLTPGLQYKIDVVALAYNNDAGYSNYKENFILETYYITAGSDIQANIVLNSLDYVYENREDEPVFSVTGTMIEEGLESGWSQISSTYTDSCYTETYSLSDFNLIDSNGEQINVLEIGYQPNKTTTTFYPETWPNVRIYFYNDNKDVIDGAAGISYVDVSVNSTAVAIIPDNAEYVKFGLGDLEYLKSYGFDVYGYHMDIESSKVIDHVANGTTTNDTEAEIVDNTYSGASPSLGTTSTNTAYEGIMYLPVTAGDVYFIDGYSTGGYLYYYNSQKKCIGYGPAISRNAMFVVPENVSYISFFHEKATTRTLYLLTSAKGESGAKYKLDATVSVYDAKGSLLDEGGASTAYLSLEYSEFANVDITEDDKFTVVETKEISLPEAEDGSYSGIIDPYTYDLDPNCTYRLCVKAVYKDNTLTLASQKLETDGALIMINSTSDFNKVQRYPYANFLVTADIDVNVTNWYAFYGTIDFDGHILTNTGSDRIFDRLGSTAVLKNLVYQLEDGKIKALVNTNEGIVENVIVKTVGNVESTTSCSTMLVNSNMGTINNFIVALGGDVNFSTSYSAIVSRINYGTIQNGYIYSENLGAVIISNPDIIYAGSVVSENYYAEGTIKNVYSNYDTYLIENSASIGYSITNYNRGNKVNNYYHVGDYYVYSDGEKEYDNPVTNRRVINNEYSGNRTEQVWLVSKYDYEPSDDDDDVNVGSIANLNDVTWQSQVLVDGFDVEGTVSMGFYPRLELPICMEKYQEYRYLPTEIAANIPVIVNDGYASSGQIDNDTAMITLRFTNPKAYVIDEINIVGLETVGEFFSQVDTEDGYSDVTLQVKVSEDPLYEEYSSSYLVESFVYQVGNSRNLTESTYETMNIAFYKEVAGIQDWYNINLHMDWNYRLTKDIVFNTDSDIKGIVLNGTLSSTSGSTQLTGILDGDGHSVSGITVADTHMPYVIYTLGETGKIKNLTINNMKLEGKSSQNTSYVGFIRVANYGSTIENVHMSNVDIDASGYIGSLAGLCRANVLNCTFNDVDITLKTNKYTINIGGVIGRAEHCSLENCYGKNIKITAKEVKNTEGIGGLIGFASAGTIYNCYVTGSIDSDSGQIGGALGYATSTASMVYNVYTDVDISTTGSSVGGIIGTNAGLISYNVALGDIFAGSSNVHRIVGLKSRADYIYYSGYAYEGQIVNDLTNEDNDDARLLFTTADLSQVKNWIDEIQFGVQWNYDEITTSLPKLYYRDTNVLLPGQTDGVGLPGSSDKIEVTVINPTITTPQAGTTGYRVDVEIKSTAGLTGYDLEDLYESDDLKLDIIGMIMPDETNTNLDDITLTPSDDKLTIRIVTTEYVSAFDTYKLTVELGETVITSVVNYGEPVYWEVPDYDTWHTLMTTGHNTTVENFKITGEIDFLNKTLDKDLILGRLLGVQKSGGTTPGFTNLSIATSNEDDGNWILSCNGVDNINFTDLIADYSVTSQYQAMASFIGYCNGDFKNSTVTGLKIKATTAEAGSLGLFYQIIGNVDSITISDIDYESTGTSVRSYHGGIASYLYGSYSKITATDITIHNQWGNYVGGLFGRVNGLANSGNTQMNENIELKNISLEGRQYVGGIVGYCEQSVQLKDIDATEIDIQAMYTAGGIGGWMYFSNLGNDHENISISNSRIISTQLEENTLNYNTGGVFGYAQYYGTYCNVTVDTVSVEGYGRVGGVVGYYDMPRIDGVYVLNSSITQHASESTADSNIGAGGIAGYWQRDNTYIMNAVVRDTTITADYNAGGILGKGFDDYQANITNAYVAEDVTITATNNNAGGVIGNHNEFRITDVAVGANIIAMGNNAGGVVGYLHGDNATQYMKGVYVRGSITASNYVGGVIGYVAKDVTLTDAKLAGVIVAADLTSENKFDLVANFEDLVSYESSKIGIWDNLLVNGQTAQSLYREATDTDITKIALKEGNNFLTAEQNEQKDDFRLATTYTTYGFTNIDCLISDTMTDSYMPFIYPGTYKSSTVIEYKEATPILYTNSYGGQNVGILRPTPGEREGATVVYVSGIDTINIETTQPSVTISVPSGKTITVADESSTALTGSVGDYTYTFTESDKVGTTYNVITIGYDFTHDITVNDTIYKSADLARTVMTNGEVWSYIDEEETNSANTSLYYGLTTTTTPKEVETITNPVHLWQGKVLASEKIYEYASQEWAENTEVSPITDGQIQATTSSIFADDTNQVYYHFTLKGDTYYGYRIYTLLGKQYPVFAAQGALYDGYILSYQSESDKTYFALLSSSTGKLTSFLDPMEQGNFINAGIKQISNGYQYQWPIVVARYESGRVVVFNYDTGQILYEEADPNLLAFARDSLSGLWNTAAGTNITSDDSFLDSNALVGTYCSMGGIDSEAETSQAGNGTTVSEDGLDAGVVDIQDQVDGGDDEKTNLDETQASTGDEENYSDVEGLSSETANESTSTGLSDETEDNDEDSEGIVNGATTSESASGSQAASNEGSGVETTVTGESIASNSNGQASETGSVANGTELAVGAGALTDGDEQATGVGATTEGDAQAGNTTGLEDDIVTDDTGEANPEEDAESSNGISGTKSDGASTGEETEATIETTINGAGGGESPDTESEEIAGTSTGSEEGVVDSDYTIGYNPYTGDYEVYDTEELLTSNVTSESKNSTMERFIEELLKVEEEADGENTFVVRKLASNVLSTDERNGFILLSVIALSCIIVLVIMHVKVRKR